jgi:MFS family permease
MAIVFVSSACMMILELVAGRIMAPYVGVSLYSWTGVIGVILAGMSLGNYLGGRLADRWASLRLLGVVFFLAGLLSAAVLAVEALGLGLPGAWPIVLRIILLTAALFFLPSAVLGMVSPIVVKLSVHDLTKTGSVVGRIYAAGAVGSIVGTFATGFFLISWFGTHTVVWGVAIVLLALGAVFFLKWAGKTAADTSRRQYCFWPCSVSWGLTAGQDAGLACDTLQPGDQLLLHQGSRRGAGRQGGAGAHPGSPGAQLQFAGRPDKARLRL